MRSVERRSDRVALNKESLLSAVRSGAKRCEAVRSGANGATGANGANTSCTLLPPTLELQALYVNVVRFHDSIAQLLYTFPLDHVTGEGTKFWSGPKRPPKPLSFDASDSLHMDFVTAAANLYAASLGLKQQRDRAELSRMATAVKAI